ncbi:MAG: efflux transporter outer membrane subunit [Pseudomonadota bacterium]
MRLAISAVCIWLAGCSFAPTYHIPEMDLPAKYAEASDPVLSQIPAEWWTSYHDDDLDALIRRIDVTNQTLKKSIALLQDSRAQADAARAAYFPTAGANASATSSHVSANVVGRSLAGKTTPDRLIGFSATWEPDLFGRIGNAVDAATSRVQANADDVAAVRLTLLAEVATDYFAIRSLDREASLLRQTVDAYSSVLSMVTNRYKGGIAAESDVAQAQAQRDSTKAQLADLTLARTQLQHALATLVGEPASTFSIAPHDAYGTQLPEIPAAVPSELLKRRPDIAAVERRVSAASSQIGVAKAAFFPSLMLNLSGGVESSGLAGLLTAPGRFWAVGPALAATIFDGGKRQAGVDSAQAQFDAAAADYRQTVLTAVQDVEDSYAATRLLTEAASSQEAAVQASQRALAQATDRYKKGAAAYLDVNVVEATTLTNERTLESIHRRQLVSSVALFRSLGGGWQAKDGADAQTTNVDPLATSEPATPEGPHSKR